MTVEPLPHEAQEALTEAERIRAETEVAEARGRVEAVSPIAAEATAREEAGNIRLDAGRRVGAVERDAADRIQTALDEQRRTLAEERQRAEEQAEQLRRETDATVQAESVAGGVGVVVSTAARNSSGCSCVSRPSLR